MYGEAAGQMPQSAGPASTAADMHAGRARGQPHANMPYGHNMDVSELRLRLLTGLRAQFQARRKQGIITGPAYDVLNYACKQGLHE